VRHRGSPTRAGTRRLAVDRDEPLRQFLERIEDLEPGPFEIPVITVCSLGSVSRELQQDMLLDYVRYLPPANTSLGALTFRASLRRPGLNSLIE